MDAQQGPRIWGRWRSVRLPHLAVAMVVSLSLLFAGMGRSPAFSRTPLPSYHLIDLGVQRPTFDSYARDVNAHDVVLGNSIGLFPDMAQILWQDHRFTDLSTIMPRDEWGTPTFVGLINDKGDWLSNLDGRTFIRHPDGRVTWIAGMGDVNAVNNQDQLAGALPGCCTLRAARWSAGNVTAVNLPYESYGFGINQAGDVVGGAIFSDRSGEHPLLWTASGRTVDLGTFGGCLGDAYAVNASIQVVGTAEIVDSCNGPTHAFLWQHGSKFDLGTLPGCTSSTAWDINDSGRVVGECDYAGGISHAFLWENGIMTDLNAIVDVGSDWLLENARRINGAGVIVGKAFHNGHTHAFVLVPRGYTLPTVAPTNSPSPTATATPTPSTRPTQTPIPDPADKAVSYAIDPAHTGRVPHDRLRPPLRRRWSRILPGYPSYPLIAGGRVFVTLFDGVTQHAELHALSADTGRTEWWHPIGHAFRGAYEWATAAYDNGKVFVINNQGNLAAFDAVSGTPQWQTELAPNSYFIAPPTAIGGMVYGGASGQLYAVHENDGVIAWSKPVGPTDRVAPAVSDKQVIQPTGCQWVYSLDAITGSQQWVHQEADCGAGERTAAVYEGKVYEQIKTGSGLIFDALHGAVVGHFDSGPADPPPAFVGSLGLFLYNGHLIARNVNTGATAWTFTGDGGLLTSPVVARHVAYIGSASGKVYGLDVTTGRVKWSAYAGDVIRPDDALLQHDLAVGEGILAVPARNRLVVFDSARK